MDLATALEILARRPPADRPAWTRAQQTVLWHLIWTGGGEHMREFYNGLKSVPETETIEGIEKQDTDETAEEGE